MYWKGEVADEEEIHTPELVIRLSFFGISRTIRPIVVTVREILFA